MKQAHGHQEALLALIRGHHAGKTFLFSYGSNNPHQAAERLELDYEWLISHTVPCKAKGY